MVTQLHIHVHILLSHIIMLHCKWLHTVFSDTQQDLIANPFQKQEFASINPKLSIDRTLSPSTLATTSLFSKSVIFFSMERFIETCLFKSFVHFKIGILVFLLKCKYSSHILIQISYQLCDLHIFSTFQLVVCSLSWWYLLKYKSGWFWWIPIDPFFLLPLVQTSSLVSYLWNHCLIYGHKSLTPILFSKCLVV